MNYDQAITLAYPITEIRRYLGGELGDASLKGVSRENEYHPVSYEYNVRDVAEPKRVIHI